MNDGPYGTSEGRSEFDAVVCGAGVGGLASARALDAIGLRVLVVDKQARPRSVAKGEVLQPGALRALRRWGTDRLLTRDGALRLGKLVVRDPSGGPLMALDYGRLPPADSSLLAHDHLAILDALTAGLSPSVEIRRGVRVAEALRDDSGRVVGVRLDGGDGSPKGHGDGDVTGTEDGDDPNTADSPAPPGSPRRPQVVYAPLVVAADGIGSRLRRAAGIGGTRRDYPHRLVSFELTGPPLSPEDFSAYLTDRGLRLVYPLPGGRVRLYIQAEPGELRGLDRAGYGRWGADAVREVAALAPLAEAVPGAAATRQLFPVARFLAERLTAPGLALVGESAHAVHPMAAQGMNSAITGAASLADHLAHQLAPDARQPESSGLEEQGAAGTDGRLTRAAVDAALREYERERSPVLAHTARTSDNAARMVTDLSLPGRVLGRRAVRCTGANPRLLHAITYNMAGLGPRPLTVLDRLHQIGLLPDPRAHRVPQE